jgi:hypothetical protein
LATVTSVVMFAPLPAKPGAVLRAERSTWVGGVGVGVGVVGGGTKRMSSHLSGTGQVLSSLTCEMSPMSAAPMKTLRGPLVGNLKLSVASEPVKVARPGHSTQRCWKPMAGTAGLMSISMPCGKGERKSQLPAGSQTKMPLVEVVLKVKVTPALVMEKLCAPLGASPGPKGTSIAPPKAESLGSKMRRA